MKKDLCVQTHAEVLFLIGMKNILKKTGVSGIFW